jgi:putative phosphoesterase
MTAIIDLTGVTRIGVVSDTHGLVRPELFTRLAGVDVILHGGDVGEGTVEIELASIAPCYAVAGNVDGFEASHHPRFRLFQLGGLRIGLTHVAVARSELTASVATWVAENDVRVLVYGHSHVPNHEVRADGLVLVNPGSCGPKRFDLPVSIGFLRPRPGAGGLVNAVDVELVRL